MSTLSVAIEQLKRGGMIILVDDEDRENEGDFVMSAEHANGEAINFMITHGRGLVCLAMTGAQIDRLELPPMVTNNRTRRSTAFTVSIEAIEGITTGISAHERAHSILTAVNPDVTPKDIVSPGHVFPLRAAENGVLKRNGHTEGSTDLMRMAGLNPAAVICEVVAEDGQMARRPMLEKIAAKFNLPILTIEEIVRHRLATETLVEHVAQAQFPTEHADQPLQLHAFRSLIDDSEHVAIVKPGASLNPLVRVHSECLTGDAFGSLRCDCGPQLQESLRQVALSDGGAVIYLKGQEGRGIGLANKIKAYALQDEGHDTAEANLALGLPQDTRDYAIAAQIIRALGMNNIRLLSNNPQKLKQLAEYGITISEKLSLDITSNPFNARYLETKREKFGHSFQKH